MLPAVVSIKRLFSVILVKPPTQLGLKLSVLSVLSKTQMFAALWKLDMILLCLKPEKTGKTGISVFSGFDCFRCFDCFAYGLCESFDVFLRFDSFVSKNR